MKTWERIKQLLGEPTYRTKLGFFFLIGIVIILFGSFVTDPTLQNIFQQFAVTFSAVAVIQFLWDFLGGEPVEVKIQEVQEEIEKVGQSLTLLGDLVEGNIGLERI